MADRFELAHRTWPILVEAAKLHQVMTYLDVAQRLGYKNARPMRQVLSRAPSGISRRTWPRASVRTGGDQ